MSLAPDHWQSVTQEKVNPASRCPFFWAQKKAAPGNGNRVRDTSQGRLPSAGRIGRRGSDTLTAPPYPHLLPSFVLSSPSVRVSARAHNPGN